MCGTTMMTFFLVVATVLWVVVVDIVLVVWLVGVGELLMPLAEGQI